MLFNSLEFGIFLALVFGLHWTLPRRARNGLLLLASFVRFNCSFFQAQARYLFPALPAASLAFCLGLQQLTPAAWRSRVLVLFVVGVAVLAAAGTSCFILPRFGPS